MAELVISTALKSVHTMLSLTRKGAAMKEMGVFRGRLETQSQIYTRERAQDGPTRAG